MAELPGNPPPLVLPPRPKNDPEQFVCPWKPFSVVTVVTSAGMVGGGYLTAQNGGMPWIIAYVLICVTLGLMFTLAGTAWGAAIALAEMKR